MKYLFLLLLVLCWSGCASRAIQTEKILQDTRVYPDSAQVKGVPFVEQSAGHCGPATLTMAMNWAGKPVHVQDVAKQVLTPDMKGSLQMDMVSAGRRNGLLAIPIEGMENLLKEVAAGHPVIIFENLGLSWVPQWHYAIVFGYDLQRQVLVMHSGPDAFKEEDLKIFERSWMLGKYWGMVVLPPTELAATAGEMPHLTAAAGLEQIGDYSGAAIAYDRILSRWPKSLGAHIGLANVAFETRQYIEAVAHLTRAADLYPDSAVVWHNLAVAQGAARMKSQAKVSAKRALSLASGENKKNYSENLKDWM